MEASSFKDYLKNSYPSPKSRASSAYLKSIEIIDDIFRKNDVFDLNNTSIAKIKNPVLIARIIEFIEEEEDKFRLGVKSIFDLGKPTQTSYPKGRFCTAAVHKLGEFVNENCHKDLSGVMKNFTKGKKLATALSEKYDINEKGTEKEVRAKRRVGQDLFRNILLEIYDNKCCLSGLDIPQVLRASHIIPWSESAPNRLNPENGLCLSATYDAAFDRHLITFDEDYRLVLSPILKELYTSKAFKTHFLDFEGRAIQMPSLYKPSQIFLEKHREKLLVS